MSPTWWRELGRFFGICVPVSAICTAVFLSCWAIGNSR